MQRYLQIPKLSQSNLGAGRLPAQTMANYKSGQGVQAILQLQYWWGGQLSGDPEVPSCQSQQPLLTSFSPSRGLEMTLKPSQQSRPAAHPLT